jgi:chromosome partitioning protein
VTEANLLLVPVAPTKAERRKLIATFDEAERPPPATNMASPSTWCW